MTSATAEGGGGLSPSDAEVVVVARGIATAVAPESGLTEVQAALLRAMTRAVTGIDIDYASLDPLGSAELASELYTKAALADPFAVGFYDPDLVARWEAFADLPDGSLGRSVHDMYRARAFSLPGSPGAASPYLAQHDFVHVLADYGTALEGELEVFAFVGRADPDPKGFAWLATMIGLFETGYVYAQGPFEMDIRERHLRTTGMYVRLADAVRRGKLVSESYVRDLFEVDYHELADRPVEYVRNVLCIPAKADDAIAAGSVGPFDSGGMSAYQLEAGRRLAAEST